MLMLEAQKYLAGVSPDANRAVGSTFELTFDQARFEPRFRRWFLRDVPPDAPPASAMVDQGEQVATARGAYWLYAVNDARRPGVYRFDLTPRPDPGGATTPGESVGVAFNIDTAAEGDLRRASRDELAAAAPGMQLHAPGSGLARVLRARPADLSESPWFFLTLLGLLVGEQALAVHLSYHLRGDAPAAIGGPR
jgi:hypothetical protein